MFLDIQTVIPFKVFYGLQQMRYRMRQMRQMRYRMRYRIYRMRQMR